VIDQLERPSADAPRENRTESLRAAARLLRTELLDIRNKIARFDKDRVIPEAFAFPAAEWDKYRELIAREPELYDVLATAYTATHRVNEIFVWRRTVSTSRLIGVSDSDGLDDADAAARAAVAALDALIARPAKSAAAPDPLTLDGLIRRGREIRKKRVLGSRGVLGATAAILERSGVGELAAATWFYDVGEFVAVRCTPDAADEIAHLPRYSRADARSFIQALDTNLSFLERVRREPWKWIAEAYHPR
jgi:hypothetical protein